MNRWLCTTRGLTVFAALAMPAAAADKLPRLPQLFVDLHGIENAHPSKRWKRMNNVQQTFHQAVVHPRPVLKPEAPWERGGFTTSAIYDNEEKLFKMWYLGGIPTRGNVTCYAVSDDGIHWRRPKLGLHVYRGSRDNNIVISVDYQGFLAAFPAPRHECQ